MEFLVVVGVLLFIGLVLKEKDKDKPAPQPTPEPVPMPVVEQDLRPKLILDTDAHPENDPDDWQSLGACISHANVLFNVIGIVSTSVEKGRAKEQIERKLNQIGMGHIPVYQGATSPNYSLKNEGSRFYVESLKSDKVEVWVWGPITTLAQAADTNAERMKSISRCEFIASTNRKVDQGAFNFLRSGFSNHFELRRCEFAFRGMMRGGNVDKLVSLDRHIKNSPIKQFYTEYPVTEASYRHQNWKAGDLPTYLFSINPSLADSVFRPDVGLWKVDDEDKEEFMASDGIRDWMISRVKANLDLY